MRRAVLIFLCSLTSSLIYSQVTDRSGVYERLAQYASHVVHFNRHYPQEKVYLHMDNRSYYIGDTIWFKAYVMNATTLHPTQTSGVLYVELLNDFGVEIDRRKLEIRDGMCHGEFPLTNSYRTGYYEIRAYTRNMLNYGNEEKVRSSGTSLVMEPAVVTNYNACAKGKQSPIDKEHQSSIVSPYNNCVFSRVVPVYRQPEREDKYQKEMLYYPRHTMLAFPKEINYALRPDSLKIKFYPEGGTLVEGINSIVAFEATDQWGRKCNVSGHITEGAKDTINRFDTVVRGRGMFSLCPRAGKAYYAHVEHKGKAYSFLLPKSELQGYTLHLSPPIGQSDASICIIASPDAPYRLLGLTLQCRGELLALDTLTLGYGETIKIRLPREVMNVGVNQMTLFDESGELLADRLFFVPPHSRQSVELEMANLSDSILPYERVHLALIMKDDTNRPRQGCFSLAVTDADECLDTYDTGDIRSELLLSSELKGFIEDVDSYFNHDNAREMAIDIDLLMLVQGWRRYDWKLMSGKQPYRQRYSPEKGLVIDGYVVSGRMSRGKSKYNADNYTRIPNLRMELSIYEKSAIWRDSTRLDSLGRFSVDVNYLIHEEKGLELKLFPLDGKNKELSKKDPYIIMNRAFSPSASPYSYYQNHAPSEWSQFDMSQFTLFPGTKTLNEVIVKKRRRGKREIYYDRPEFVIDYYKEWNNIIDRGVPLVLILPPSHVGRRTGISLDYSLGRVNVPISYLELHTLSGNLKLSYLLPQRIKVYSNLLTRGKMLLLDDENETKMQTLCVAESDIEMITPKVPPFASRSNTRSTYFEGYSRVREFYSPDYSECALPDSADYRRTLYWNPDVRTDHLGRASVSFYNNARTKRLHVRAEGFTRNGEFIVYDSNKQ